MREGVKSQPNVSARFGAALSTCALIVGVASSASAQAPRDAPLLFGGGLPLKKTPIQTDPWLPTGAEVSSTLERPGDAEPPGCSFRAPVCVHRGPGVSAEAGRRAVMAMESAYARLVGVLGLPGPAADAGRGGSDALDLYLRAGGSADVSVGVEPNADGRFDRAAGFCLLGRADRALLERAATLCFGEAIALALDPAETPHLRRAYAEHLWLRTGTPTSVDAEVIDDVQANPERALATRGRTRQSEGAAILFEYLDAARGAGHPGALATSLFSAAVGKTEPSAWLWDDSPDLFDVLRHSLEEKPRAEAALFLDLAVTRAFLGNRDDGTHLPELQWLGAFGRPRFDWSFPLSSLPRRVAVTPVEPTGAVYLWLGIDADPKGVELGFRAEWEGPVTFQWSLVRVAADGQELGRLNAPFVERGTEVQQNLVELDGAAGVLIVGTNLGDVDMGHRFDPDFAPFEPHACTVYVTKL